MNKQEIEQALRRATDQLPATNYEHAAHASVQRMEVHDHITCQSPVPRGPRRLIPLAAACLLLLICAGGWYYTRFIMVYSTVCLNVNPSFTITLNRKDEVLDVEAHNDEAEVLLQGRSYRSWTLNATLEFLADDMVGRGYLTSPQDTVRVSVESRSEDRATVLRIETEAFFAWRLERLAQPVWPAEPSPAPEPSPVPPYGDEPSGQERITPEEAKAVIRAKAPGVEFHEVKLDQDDHGAWIYEMECYVGREKYDAEVDAVSGALLQWEWDD